MIDSEIPDFTITPISEPKLERIPSACEVLEPQVSVITPYFNMGEIFLETALSLRLQTFQNFELIIIDDGSDLTSDRSEIFNQVISLLPQARVIRSSDNQGLPAARNFGVKNANSQFIFLLDADDLIEPTTIEKYLWYLVTHPEHAFVSGYEVGFGANNYLNDRGFKDKELYRTENLKNPISMIRQSAYVFVDGFDSSIRGGLEDWDFWFRMAENNLWGGTIPEYLNWYRWSENQHLKWSNWASKENMLQFRSGLEMKYPRAFAQPFSTTVSSDKKVIIENPRQTGRAVIVLEDGSGEIHFSEGATIVFKFEPAKEVERAAYRASEDVFVLERFLPIGEFDSFIEYLRGSRGA
jgi:glycosyltransferase involved in cell wall biosynthesis